MIFGRQPQTAGRSVLILDIENGSIGSAIARADAQGALSLIGPYRQHLPVPHTRAADILAKEIEKSLHHAIAHGSEVAARLRNQSRVPEAGIISDVAVFLAPPWGRPNLLAGAPDFVPHMQELVARDVRPFFEHEPTFFTSAGASMGALRTLLPYEDKFLLAIVTHEMTELVLVHEGRVVGHATIPHGINLPLRTLKSHAGLSDRESRAALEQLSHDEPLSHATEHYAKEFKAVAKELFGRHAPERVWVVSPMGEYFARALSHESLGSLFPQGGVVRALRPEHLAARVPAAKPDLFLQLQALFVAYTNF